MSYKRSLGRKIGGGIGYAIGGTVKAVTKKAWKHKGKTAIGVIAGYAGWKGGKLWALLDQPYYLGRAVGESRSSAQYRRGQEAESRRIAKEQRRSRRVRRGRKRR